MDIDERIAAAEELIAKRKEIDARLAALFAGQAPEKKQRICAGCGKPGHTLRNCPEQGAASPVVE